jgi:hypothetical protein
VLLTRSPLRHTSWLPVRYASLDLHALGAPPAFVLSQDQTLQRTVSNSPGEGEPRHCQRDSCYASSLTSRDALEYVHLVRGGLLTIFGTLFSCQGARSAQATTPGGDFSVPELSRGGRGRRDPDQVSGTGTVTDHPHLSKHPRLPCVDVMDLVATVAMIRSRGSLFREGWGEVPAPPEDTPAVAVTWGPLHHESHADLLDGTFTSPAPLPPRARTGHVRWVRPLGSDRVCLLMAASNEEGFARRSALAELLAQAGIGTLMLENPYYGLRRVHGGSAPVRTVGELLTMGSAAVQEARGLLLGLRDLTIGIGGYSMGGNIAGLVAATFPGALVTIPMAPSPSPAPVYTRGVLAQTVAWPALGGRTAAEPLLREVLGRASILRLPPPTRPDLAIIVGARGDGYIPAHEVEAIHRHWPGSEMRWENGGHLRLALTGRRRLARAVIDAFDRVTPRV